MTNYSGCKCPYCQQPFTDQDDIVVCPDCGAPYHRSCYQEQGSCMFTDRHGPDFEWKPVRVVIPHSKEDTPAGEPNFSSLPEDSDSPHEVICPVCGAMNPEHALFCETCGAPLRGASPAGAAENGKAPASYGSSNLPDADPFHIAGLPIEVQVHPEEEFDGINAKDWAAYLGDNAAWYLLNFKQMKLTGRKIAISLSAFLFGPLYFLYRKMWLPAASLLVCTMLLYIPTLLQLLLSAEGMISLGISPNTVSVLSAVCSTISIILQVLCGTFSVYLYKNISARRIHKLLKDGAADTAALKKAGGTSKVALLIYLGINLAAFTVLLFL